MDYTWYGTATITKVNPHLAVVTLHIERDEDEPFTLYNTTEGTERELPIQLLPTSVEAQITIDPTVLFTFAIKAYSNELPDMECVAVYWVEHGEICTYTESNGFFDLIGATWK